MGLCICRLGSGTSYLPQWAAIVARVQTFGLGITDSPTPPYVACGAPPDGPRPLADHSSASKQQSDRSHFLFFVAGRRDEKQTPPRVACRHRGFRMSAESAEANRRILRRPEVEARCGFKRAHLYKLIDEGKFLVRCGSESEQLAGTLWRSSNGSPTSCSGGPNRCGHRRSRRSARDHHHGQDPGRSRCAPPADSSLH